jgi:hypothetical protein
MRKIHMELLLFIYQLKWIFIGCASMANDLGQVKMIYHRRGKMLSIIILTHSVRDHI